MNGKIYVPNNRKIRKKILQENHELVDVEHPGQQCIIELIKRNYQWLGIKNNVKKNVQGCFKCQQNKMQHMKRAEELHLLEMPEEPWQEISINIIGLLPRSNGKYAIVVIVDQFTKII